MMPFPWNRKPTAAKHGVLATLSNRVCSRALTPHRPKLPTLPSR